MNKRFAPCFSDSTRRITLQLAGLLLAVMLPSIDDAAWGQFSSGHSPTKSGSAAQNSSSYHRSASARKQYADSWYGQRVYSAVQSPGESRYSNRPTTQEEWQRYVRRRASFSPRPSGAFPWWYYPYSYYPYRFGFGWYAPWYWGGRPAYFSGAYLYGGTGIYW